LTVPFRRLRVESEFRRIRQFSHIRVCPVRNQAYCMLSAGVFCQYEHPRSFLRRSRETSCMLALSAALAFLDGSQCLQGVVRAASLGRLVLGQESSGAINLSAVSWLVAANLLHQHISQMCLHDFSELCLSNIFQLYRQPSCSTSGLGLDWLRYGVECSGN